MGRPAQAAAHMVQKNRSMGSAGQPKRGAQMLFHTAHSKAAFQAWISAPLATAARSR